MPLVEINEFAQEQKLCRFGAPIGYPDAIRRSCIAHNYFPQPSGLTLYFRYPETFISFSDSMKNHRLSQPQSHNDMETDDSAYGHDLEKYPYDSGDSTSEYDDERSASSCHSISSRTSSGSQQPMRPKPASRRSMGSYLYRIPNRLARYFCLALISTIVIFILALIRMSWTSSQQLESGLIGMAPRPAQWESFEFLKRYYGGIRTIGPKEQNIPEYPYDHEDTPGVDGGEAVSTRQYNPLPQSRILDPYPDYTSTAYTSRYGEKHECFLDSDDSVYIPRVRYYEGIPRGFPDAVIGSNNVLGIRNDICFDRFGRLGPYGLGYSLERGGTGAGLSGESEGAENVWSETREVDYTSVRWADAQKACTSKNQRRFDPRLSSQDDMFQSTHVGRRSALSPLGSGHKARDIAEVAPIEGKEIESKHTDFLPRTAILIRTYTDYKYNQEEIMNIRSLISELALLSGGEYTVHFLIHVKNDKTPIWADKEIYERLLENSLPKEFHGMGTLWSERQMLLIYGGLHDTMFRGLPVHGVYRSTYMPVQFFAHQNPQYEFFYNWEMDVRYTGHWYHLFEQIRSWARSQPRKGLWERNGRYYVPSEHGTWDDFKQMVRVHSEQGVSSPAKLWSPLKPTAAGAITQPSTDTPIWGPAPPIDMLQGQEDAKPPTTYAQDHYTWGVGEEADLITFGPMFDPAGTTWLYANDFTGYNTTEGLPARRTSIITASRLSRKLLETMHRETAIAKHTMFSEMWPASCALHHGFKAVYAPHPTYVDRNWPTNYLASVFNGGRNGAAGGSRTSVYGDREHNFRGMTWYYNAGFPFNLWRRWLGYRVDNAGGEEEELEGEGRMCLPPMLLHPVKGMDLVIEGLRDK